MINAPFSDRCVLHFFFISISLEIAAGNIGVYAQSSDGIGSEGKDDAESQKEQEEQDYSHDDFLLQTITIGEVTILPDDIGGL